jgi:hypothetical protein
MVHKASTSGGSKEREGEDDDDDSSSSSSSPLMTLRGLLREGLEDADAGLDFL